MIVGCIGRHPKDRKKYAVVDEESGRYACTHWKLIENLGNFSFLNSNLIQVERIKFVFIVHT